MIFLDGVQFDDIKVKSVSLNLDTCLLTLYCEFYSSNTKRRMKEFVMKTDCDVDINEYIIKLKQKLSHG